jgi:enoyl-CoA hydratase
MIEREDRGAVRILRLAHGRASALDLELLEALSRAIAEFEQDSPRAAVLTGSGSIFCAGIDLKRLCSGGAPYVRRLLPALESATAALFSCDKPIVAALNGHAVAGGYVLACACDRRLMAAGEARVGLPEMKVGVPFPTLVMEVLRAAVAPPMLQELLLMGGTHAATGAVAAGLIDEVIAREDLVAAACDAARRLSEAPPAAYASTKRNLRAPAIEAWQRHAANDAAIIEQWCSDDTLAAIRAYVERTLG